MSCPVISGSSKSSRPIDAEIAICLLSAHLGLFGNCIAKVALWVRPHSSTVFEPLRQIAGPTAVAVLTRHWPAAAEGHNVIAFELETARALPQRHLQPFSDKGGAGSIHRSHSGV